MIEENNEKELTEEEKKIEYTKKLLQHFQKLQLIDLGIYPYRTKEQIVGTFKREDLRKYLEAPELEANQKQLRRISKYLYNASSQYKLVCDYYATILTLDHIVEAKNINPEKINKKSFKSNYYKTVDLVENMNIQHEFSKVLQIVSREGMYCGYVHHNSESFFLQQLDNDYTKITYVEDGLYYISFNLTYFFVYPERLSMYPDEFKQAYNDIKGNIKRKSAFFWYQLDSSNTICIKHDESTWHSLPPHVSTFESALNIADFKALDKAEAEIGNSKLLFQKIPIDEKSNEENKFLITADVALKFHENIQANLPRQVGIITSPMDVQDISFDKDSVDRNKVNDATMQYWSDAGVSQLLFSSNGKTTAASLAKAIQTDEAKAFTILYQLERWINKYITKFAGVNNFRVRMLKTTIFNVDDFVKNTTTAASFGLPVKLIINAALGGKASSIYTNAFLENEILGLQDKLVPLQSAHTTPGDSGGRPKSDKPLTDSGEKSNENDSNNPDVRG